METINVVEAKKNFSDLMSRVAYGGQQLIIERHNKPMMVWISVEEYQRLQGAEMVAVDLKEKRLAALEQANRLRSMIHARRNGELLTDSADLLYQMRDEQVKRYDLR